MAYLAYILPWVMLLLAVGAVFAHKLLEFKSIMWIVSIATSSVLFLGCNVLLMINAAHLHGEVKEAKHKLDDMESWKYRYMDEITLAISQIRPMSQSNSTLLDQAKNWGWIPMQPTMRKLDDANQVRDRILSTYYPRSENLFKGLPKLIDQNLVDLSLRQVGFTNVPYRPEEEVPDEVNVIYFGKNLDIRDVKLVALTLMRAGIELKAIRPFPKDTQGNLQAIKAEFNKTMDVRRSLTAAEIEKATIFK